MSQGDQRHQESFVSNSHRNIEQMNQNSLRLLFLLIVSFPSFLWHPVMHFPLTLHEGPWDGSKSHRRRQSHVTPCMHNLEMAQNSNHWVFLYFLLEILITCLNPELAHFFGSKRNWIRGKNDSNFEPSQNFRTKKSEPTQNLDTWSRFRRENKEKLNGSNFEPSQSYACTESRVIVSFDDFLSHLRYPPVTWTV